MTVHSELSKFKGNRRDSDIKEFGVLAGRATSSSPKPWADRVICGGLRLMYSRTLSPPEDHSRSSTASFSRAPAARMLCSCYQQTCSSHLHLRGCTSFWVAHAEQSCSQCHRRHDTSRWSSPLPRKHSITACMDWHQRHGCLRSWRRVRCYSLLMRKKDEGSSQASMRSPPKGSSTVSMRAYVHSRATLPSSVILHGHQHGLSSSMALLHKPRRKSSHICRCCIPQCSAPAFVG